MSQSIVSLPSSRALLAAIVLCAWTSVAAVCDAFSEESNVATLPQSYVILKDRSGLPLAGAYWIGQGTKLVLRGEARDLILVDREFLPRRMTSVFKLIIRRVEYQPEIDLETLVEATPLEISRSHFTSFPDLSSSESAYNEKFKGLELIRLLPSGSKQVTIGGVTTRRVDYEMTAPSPFSGLGTATTRAYYPEFDIDLDATLAERVTAIEQGTASSSVDFEALYISRGAITAPAVVCIEQKRASEPYLEASAKYRLLADAHTATSFPEQGLNFDLDLGLSTVSDLLKTLNVRDCLK